MFNRTKKILIAIVMTLSFCLTGFIGTETKAEAASATSYSLLRPYMVYGSYGSNGHLGTDYWSCAGWVSRVLYTAGLAGELNGYIPDFTGYADASASGLEAFMKSDDHFELVATFNNGNPSDAAARLLAQMDAAEVKAGDIIIYYGYSGRYDNSWGREHAAIILADKYNGRVSNTSDYNEERWGSSYIGHPTVAHSMNYSYGVEFYTPIDGHFFCGDATGYAVYRLKAGKVSDNTMKSVVGENEKIEPNVTADTYKSVDSAKIVKTTYKGASGWYYSKSGKVVTSYTGFAKNSKGWWYVKNGKVDFDKTGIVKGNLGNASGWWYVKNGKVSFTNTVAKNDNGWWVIRNGQVDFSYTGIAKNENGWWRIKNGKVDFSFTDLLSNEHGWWYFRGGKIDFSYTGIVKNQDGWWYVKNGKLSFSDTVAKNQYGWWCVQEGKVNFEFTGFAGNENGWWYCRNGKVDFSYSGTVYGKVNGNYGYYTVRGGRVIY